MPETANYSQLARRPTMATLHKLRWIEEEHFHSWGCSECAWTFNSSGPPVGSSFNEMLENFALLRDKECAAHVCAEHPRPENREKKTY
jgi:hypothetical protein